MNTGDAAFIKRGSFHNLKGSEDLPVTVYRVMAGGEYVILQFESGEQVRARTSDVRTDDD